MSEENTNIVPVDKVNIENAAAVTGGFLGFVLAGPLAGVFLAALTNYVVKKENDSGEALRLMLSHIIPLFVIHTANSPVAKRNH